TTLIGPAIWTSPMTWSLTAERVGTSFTALTVSRKLVLTAFVPSLTISVIVALPLASGMGVTVTVRFEPEPPKTMLFVGTRIGFRSEERRVGKDGGVWTAATHK